MLGTLRNIHIGGPTQMQDRIARLIATVSLLLTSATHAQTVNDARVGLMNVRQLASDNSRQSVRVSVPASALSISAPEANRGDFDAGFGTGDDLNSGVMIVSPRNGSRSNTSNGNSGGNMGGDLYATVATQRPPSKVDLIVSAFGAPSGSEMNVDVAAVFFPFNAGFIAGHALNNENNGPIDRLVASPGLTLGLTFTDSAASDGVYGLDLTAFGANGANGVLIACGGDNEDNFALTRNLGAGQYEIICKDNADDGTGSENDPVAFVYLPYSMPGLFAGRVAQSAGVASLISSTGGVTVTTIAPGRVLVRVVGVSSGIDGAMLVCPESPIPSADNIVVCEWSDSLQGFVVESLDIPSMAPEETDGPMFSFAYIPVTPGPAITPSDGASTIVALPDTQYYARDYPAIFHSQTQWIADNAAARNIAMVLHLGDITNDNDDAQWTVARQAMDRIHLRVPYLLAQGNHDVGPSGNGSSRQTLMNSYFPASRMMEQPTWGGSLNNNQVENAYSLFEAGGRKWIALALEWGPRDPVLDWAGAVLEAHSDRLAIVVTHAYMFDDDTRMDHTVAAYNGSPYDYGTATLPGGTNDGGDVWRELVSLHPNVVMVLSGHVTGEGRLSSPTPFGNVVHQMLTDYQGRLEGGAGYLRLIELFPGSDVVRFRTYSPWESSSYTGTGSYFELTLTTAPGHEGWVCSRGDVNGDGVLTPADFTAWIARFNGSAPGCDQNRDGSCTPADFAAWIQRYNTGCG